MSRVIRPVVNRLRDAVDAVFHHAATFQVHQRQRQAPVKVFTRLQRVAPVLDKKLGPGIKTLFIEGCGIELVHFVL